MNLTSNISDTNSKTQLEYNGIYLEVISPIFIQGIDFPIGMISAYYGLEKSKSFTDELYLKQTLQKTSNQIALIYSKEYSKITLD